MPQDPMTFQSRARRPPPEPEAIDLRILYEDEWLMAIDKTPGMVVHPTYRNWSGTLLNALLWHVRHRATAQPSIVTRLDKDTSGVVLVALSPDVHAHIQRDAIARRLGKEYLAIISGVPTAKRGSITLPLGRNPDDRRRVVVTAAGQHCHTIYEVLSSSNGHSLVRCELVTGRTHQIRVHLAAQGWPVAGDRVYGDATGGHRQALHAWRLTLTHPLTRKRLEIEAAIPPDLQQLIVDQNLTL
jgi:23S rRNA pseudouridine1911/1915/1917 synthase